MDANLFHCHTSHSRLSGALKMQGIVTGQVLHYIFKIYLIK